MNTPRICLFEIMAPNIAIPTIVVINGATELKIEVIPLSNSVCAKANKKGGKKELVNPAIINHFQSFGAIEDKLRNPKTKRVKEAITTLNPPNCRAVKPKSAFLINMKDEPQIKDRSTR